MNRVFHISKETFSHMTGSKVFTDLQDQDFYVELHQFSIDYILSSKCFGASTFLYCCTKVTKEDGTIWKSIEGLTD